MTDRIKTHAAAAGIRALRTFLQTLIPALGAGAITELDYIGALSIAAGAALISFLNGVLGALPEVDGEKFAVDQINAE